MINLSLEAEVARLQHQDRLRQAEQARLYRELAKDQTGWLRRLHKRLTATGWQLKAQTRSNPVIPAFSKR